MKIRQFIKHEFVTVDAYHGVSQIRKKIATNSGAVVLIENTPIGYLSPKDLVSHSYNLVIDCMSEKPKLSADLKIQDALKIMEGACSDILLVYEEANFIGILDKGDITNYLVNMLEFNRLNLQGVAHDLKNPISNMMGILHILEQSLENPDDTELLTFAKKACKTANDLITELLKPASDQTQVTLQEKVDLNQLILKCINDIQLNIEKKQIRLKVSPPIDQRAITMGNSVAARRVIDNLLSNAIKFTPDRGQIEIITDINHDHYTISIADSGIGIPEHMKPFLFDKFTAAKRMGTQGEPTTGLGLHTTKMICEQYQIGFDYESTEGKGSIFYLKFPINSLNPSSTLL